MTKKVKLFLPNDFYDELLYQYEGKDGELRKLVFGLLKPLAKQGKMVKLNGMLQCRIMKEGKMSMEEKDMKNIDLGPTTPKSDDMWIPEKVKADEIQVYELSISERLYDDLVYFTTIFAARLDIWNKTLDPKSEKYKDEFAKLPACLEQVIQDNVVGNLSKQLAENIDKDYDEEFQEIEKKIPKPPKRDSPKKE